MTPAQALRQPNAAAAKYLEDEINALHPTELILKVYDFAIAGCRQHDADKVSRALVELIAALNFEHRQIALPLFRLYEYCMRSVKAGQFDAALPILWELREAWQQVVSRECLRQAV